MKKFSFVIVFAFVFALTAVRADQGHLEASFLDGIWLINSTETSDSPSSDHDHGDHAHRTNIRFHAGHTHLPKKKQKLILSLCSDDLRNLYGKIRNRKLLVADKKYLVSNFQLDHEANTFNVTAESSTGDVLSFAIVHADLDNDKEVKISFDSGASYYTAKRKRSKASRSCRKIMLRT